VGHDLPRDADDCHATKQYELLSKNLYLTRSGDIKTLRQQHSSAYEVSKLDIPSINKQTVHNTSSPYILDINSSVSNSKKKRLEQLRKQANSPVIKKESLTTLKQPSSGFVTALHKLPALGCTRFKTFGHRGGGSGPENSIPAVLSGLKALHNGVEIDTQRLADGTWVVHHDPMIGRSSYGFNGFINLIRMDEWKHVYLYDRRGNKTNIHPPTLSALLKEFSKHAIKGQRINIEIKMIKKNQYSNAQLEKLNTLVQSILTQEQFFYTSTYLSALRAMRSINSKAYLGLIIEPNPDSLDRVINRKYGAEFLPVVNSRLPKFLRINTHKKRKSNRDWLAKKTFVELDDALISNFGLHIDYRDAAHIANTLDTYHVPWMIYELDDDTGLLHMLKIRHTKHLSLPSAIIIDSPRERFCKALF